jgi:uncharacterized protein
MPVEARSPALRESLIVFVVGMLGVAALWIGARFVPFVARHMQALVAAVFLYLPVFMAWRRGRDLSLHGFTLGAPLRSFGLGVGVTVVTLGLFFLGYYAFYAYVCGGDTTRLPALASDAMCFQFMWSGVEKTLRLPADPVSAVLTQVVVVAIPEELFFRGYLHGRLEAALPPTRRFFGGGLGAALLLSSAMFAVAHVITNSDPSRLATFFPGLLFGWLRSSTGSIVAGTILHASSNLFIDVLHRTFFNV